MTRALLTALMLWLVAATSARANTTWYNAIGSDHDQFGCATCHNNANGGGGCSTPPCLAPVGQTYASLNHDWTQTKARDSDVDGYKTGFELAIGTNPNSKNTFCGCSTGYRCSCEGGSGTSFPSCQNGSTAPSCQEIDECRENLDNCDDSPDACVNTTGAYRCQCPSGWVGNGVGSTGCDLNDCANNPCGNTSWCVDQFQTYSCNCGSGYVLVGSSGGLRGTCQSVCLNNPCGIGTCNPQTNYYTCSCPTGTHWTGAAAGRGGFCESDTCTTAEQNSCGVNSYCNKATGTVACSCWEGFQRINGVCTNINECATPSATTCASTATCIDRTPTGPRQTGYDCRCWSTYTDTNPSNPGRSCSNINECANATHNCDPESVCSDVVPTSSTQRGFACTCWSGFRDNSSGQGTRCDNINECAENTDNCDAESDCADRTPTANGQRGFGCSCWSGYRDNSSGQGTRCDNINECAENTDTCHASAVCTDVSPARGAEGYGCRCFTGFRDTAPGTAGRSCVSIDECSEPDSSNVKDDCSPDATCADRAPAQDGQASFVCTCKFGFEDRSATGQTGKVCADIDECKPGALLPNNCSPNADCINMPGAYRCTCKGGYVGNGTTCVDAAECKQRTSNDCDPNAFCVDAAGDYDCVCKPGYEGDGHRAGTGCTVRCGDGQVGPGEGCDDGDTDANDGCSETCAVEPGWACYYDDSLQKSLCAPSCGDGVIDANEECDRGEANSDSAPDGCRKSCKRARCGDGIVDSTEECDDGDGNSSDQPDACRTICRAAYCGDGVVDQNEECDGTEGCSQSCHPTPKVEQNKDPSTVGSGADAGSDELDAGAKGRGMTRGGGCSVSASTRGTQLGSTLMTLLGAALLLRGARRRRQLYAARTQPNQ